MHNSFRRIFFPVFISLLMLISFLAGCNSSDQQPDQQNRSEAIMVSQKIQPEMDEYGLPVDSLEISDHTVKRNESLYEILRRQDISPQEIYQVSQKAKDVFNIRKIKPGQEYKLYNAKDSLNTLKRLVWQPNLMDYVVIDWDDSLRIFKGKKEMTTRIKKASGVIHSSLYQSLQHEELSPVLAIKLSEIFAWEVDFFRIQNDDRFKVIYEDRYVDGEYLGIGQVLAAEFVHNGETYSAYHFDLGDKDGYFDKEGNSVQKALLKAPLKYTRISSGFSNSRYHPVLHRRMAHHGVDYAAPRGTPVHTVGDGTVQVARYIGPNGNMVKVRHNGTYTTTYIHLNRFAKGIRPGAHVKQGQVIGYVGTTGRSTGPHLDYRVFVNGKARNPLTLDLPPAKGIPDKYEASFQDYQEKLDEMFTYIHYREDMISAAVQ